MSSFVRGTSIDHAQKFSLTGGNVTNDFMHQLPTLASFGPGANPKYREIKTPFLLQVDGYLQCMSLPVTVRAGEGSEGSRLINYFVIAQGSFGNNMADGPEDFQRLWTMDLTGYITLQPPIEMDPAQCPSAPTNFDNKQAQLFAWEPRIDPVTGIEMSDGFLYNAAQMNQDIGDRQPISVTIERVFVAGVLEPRTRIVDGNLVNGTNDYLHVTRYLTRSDDSWRLAYVRHADMPSNTSETICPCSFFHQDPSGETSEVWGMPFNDAETEYEKVFSDQQTMRYTLWEMLNWPGLSKNQDAEESRPLTLQERFGGVDLSLVLTRQYDIKSSFADQLGRFQNEQNPQPLTGSYAEPPTPNEEFGKSGIRYLDMDRELEGIQTDGEQSFRAVVLQELAVGEVFPHQLRMEFENNGMIITTTLNQQKWYFSFTGRIIKIERVIGIESDREEVNQTEDGRWIQERDNAWLYLFNATGDADTSVSTIPTPTINLRTYDRLFRNGQAQQDIAAFRAHAFRIPYQSQTTADAPSEPWATDPPQQWDPVGGLFGDGKVVDVTDDATQSNRHNLPDEGWPQTKEFEEGLVRYQPKFFSHLTLEQSRTRWLHSLEWSAPRTETIPTAPDIEYRINAQVSGLIPGTTTSMPDWAILDDWLSNESVGWYRAPFRSIYQTYLILALPPFLNPDKTLFDQLRESSGEILDTLAEGGQSIVDALSTGNIPEAILQGILTQVEVFKDLFNGLKDVFTTSRGTTALQALWIGRDNSLQNLVPKLATNSSITQTWLEMGYSLPHFSVVTRPPTIANETSTWYVEQWMRAKRYGWLQYLCMFEATRYSAEYVPDLASIAGRDQVAKNMSLNWGTSNCVQYAKNKCTTDPFPQSVDACRCCTPSLEETIAVQLPTAAQPCADALCFISGFTPVLGNPCTVDICRQMLKITGPVYFKGSQNFTCNSAKNTVTGDVDKTQSTVGPPRGAVTNVAPVTGTTDGEPTVKADDFNTTFFIGIGIAVISIVLALVGFYMSRRRGKKEDKKKTS